MTRLERPDILAFRSFHWHRDDNYLSLRESAGLESYGALLRSCAQTHACSRLLLKPSEEHGDRITLNKTITIHVESRGDQIVVAATVVTDPITKSICRMLRSELGIARTDKRKKDGKEEG